jgi:GntR family transcriptional regulator/MocR family aminotransferase
MRALYSERRTALAAALAEVFDGQMSVQLQAGGMHLLARVAGCNNDCDLVARANASGLAPAALSPWVIECEDRQGLLLSFTNIPAEAAVGMAIALKQVIDGDGAVNRQVAWPRCGKRR